MSGGNWAIVMTLIVIGCAAMWIYRGTVLKAPIPIATLVLVILIGFVGYAHNTRENARKMRDQCVERVERSYANRVMWSDVGAYLQEQGVVRMAAFIQESLNKDLPVLSIDDCPKA